MNQYFSFTEMELTMLKNYDHHYAFSISEFSLSVKTTLKVGRKSPL